MAKGKRDPGQKVRKGQTQGTARSAQNLGADSPNIRILDDQSLLVGHDGSVTPIRDIRAPFIRPLLTLDTLKNEHTDPARIDALRQRYHRNFLDQRGFEFNFAYAPPVRMPDMGDAGEFSMQLDEAAQRELSLAAARDQHIEIFKNTVGCDRRTAQDYLDTKPEARAALLEKIYAGHQPNADTARVIAAAAPAATRANSMGTQQNWRERSRALLEKEFLHLPRHYRTVLNDAGVDIIAAHKLGNITDIHRLQNLGVSVSSTYQIFIDDPIAANGRNSITTPELRHTFHEEVIHTLDAITNFSNRAEWAKAIDLSSNPLGRELINGFYRRLNKDYEQLINPNTELLADISSLLEYGKPVLRDIVVRVERANGGSIPKAVEGESTEITLARIIEQAKFKPDAVLKKVAPDMLKGIESFDAEVKARAAAVAGAVGTATGQARRTKKDDTERQ